MRYAVIPAPTSLFALPASYATTPESQAALDRLATGGDVTVTLGAPPDLGEEGYRLEVEETGVRLSACTEQGLYRGGQTLRQLTQPDGTLPCVRIEDRPRFAWRGVMLDVARHFFPVADVKRFIDLVEPYKLNVLHLHLTDDQGWRLAIDAWPALAEVGGSTQVGGGPGGYYTKSDYQEIVRYAADRHLTVVPEIDMPGHTNAALAAYPELNADGIAPAPYTGTDVGFSSLPTDKEITYEFVDAVLGEVAALTPGRYLHIGGDEARSTDSAEYAGFIARVERIVRAHGKTMVGWQEIGAAPLTPGNLVQYWRANDDRRLSPAWALDAIANGAKLIMSPASYAYLDMKYDTGTPLGQSWAGLVDTRRAYEWDPLTVLDGIRPQDVHGVEAALWTETLSTFEDLAYMTLPRLPGIAEVAWSTGERSWAEYERRLAAHLASFAR